MKLQNILHWGRLLFAGLSACLLTAVNAPAALTLQLQIIHDDTGHVFTCSPNLSTDGNPPDGTPVTYDQVNSPDTNFAGGLGNGANYIRNTFADNDFNAFMYELTNSTWQLIVNAGATNQQNYGLRSAI